jgi:hypothetical protein
MKTGSENAVHANSELLAYIRQDHRSASWLIDVNIINVKNDLDGQRLNYDGETAAV